ncbi:MAG TPA: FG-GAP-like repeat-containing protein [Fimbriiglobus sp.]|nr:FG-GAP-like repeat-containing protein [Fimbriiglobus sp.]
MPTLLRCELLEDRLTPAIAGDPDPTFGNAGLAILPPGYTIPPLPDDPTPVGAVDFNPSAVIVQPDGKVLVVGTANNWSAHDFPTVALRFLPDGRLDPSFGGDGVAAIPFAPAGVTVRPDGRIVLAGVTGQESLGVAQLTADGSPDPTFGAGGAVSVPTDRTGTKLNAVAAVGVDPDGRIVLGGSANPSPTFIELSGYVPRSIAAIRLTADGRLDTTFGTGGWSTVSFPVGQYDSAVARSMAVQPDGKIVLAGSVVSLVSPVPISLHGPRVFSSTDFAVVRLTADGQLDPSFGDGGRVRVPFDLSGPTDDDSAVAVAVRPDGKVVLAGFAASPGSGVDVVVRLTADGRLDPTFDGDGKAGTSGGSTQTATILPDERVVFVGSTIVRLTADGQPDPTFGDGGHAPNPFLPYTANLPNAVQADGDVIVTGTSVVGRVLGAPNPVPVVVPTGAMLIGGRPDGMARLTTPTGGVYPTFLGVTVPFFPGFAGAVRTATADVTGDGVPDLIGGAGPGGGPAVRVLDGTTQAVLANFFAFEPTFTGGVFVAAADLDGDGKAEVVVTPDRGGGPVVAVFDGTGAERGRFLGIDDPAFRGGARPALGDVNGDGTPDLIVSAGVGGGPRIALFDGKSVAGDGRPVKLRPDFFAFEPTLRNGAFVAAGDVTGDGIAEVAFGGGPGGAPRVRVFDGAGLLAAGPFTNLDEIPTVQRANFFAGDSSLRGGVHLALRDADGDGRADLVAGSGEGEPSRVRVYRAANLLANPNPTPTPDQVLDPFGPAVLADGVFVG